MQTAYDNLFRLINENNGQAYYVGGCVRDTLLGKKPKDVDITTSLKPDEVKQLCLKNNMKTIDTGIKHGTITVLLPEGKHAEITTFRADTGYADHRHPNAVIYVTDINADLARRDFTMNAIAYDPLTETFVDPFNGRQDIENGTLRSVGDPDRRIEEDALRMMRGIRFSVQKDMKLDEKFINAIKRHTKDIDYVSNERINQELTGMLMSSHPDTAMRTLHETGLLKEILPEVDCLFSVEQNNPYHIYNVGEHTMHVLKNAPQDLDLRLAALLHDTGKTEAKTTDKNGVDHFYGHEKKSARIATNVCQRLKCPNTIKSTVTKLVSVHENRPDSKSINRFIERHSDMTDEEMMKLMDLQYADTLAQKPDSARLHEREEVKRLLSEKLKEPHRIKDLAINGNDIEKIQKTSKGETMPLAGKEIGTAQHRLLREIINDSSANSVNNLTNDISHMTKSIRMQTIQKLPYSERKRQEDALKIRKQVDLGERPVKDLVPYEIPNEIKWISDKERREQIRELPEINQEEKTVLEKEL